MENLYKVKKALMNSLEELDTAKKGKADMRELEAIKMITSSIDHINNICDHDDEGSSASGYSSRRHRDSMGRYASNGGYSHADAKREMMSHLANAYAAAPDDEHRRMARDLMDRVERV